MTIGFISLLASLDVVAQPTVHSDTHCVQLQSRTESDFTITTSEHMENYCHVEGSIRPRIGFWLLLPDSWNGRLVMRGGGGYAGQQWQKGSRDTLRDEGYAIAYTDTGHDARTEPLATFAYNDREAEIDYAYRAVHLTLKLARNLITDYYGHPAEYRYWHGCSTGGRQGLMSAQRFPEDFHGRGYAGNSLRET